MPEYLIDPAIKKLEAREERYEIADAGEAGLRLRIYPSGARAWSYWYRTKAGAARRVKLGKYPSVSLASARKQARALSVRVDRGEDPAAERQAAKAEHLARKSAGTFADTCRAFAAEELPKFRPATRDGWQRYVDREIIPRLGRLVPREVTAEHIAEMKDAITRGVPGPKGKDGSPTWKRKPAPVSAGRCFEVVRRILEWASAVDPDVETARKRHSLVRLAANPAATARGYRQKRKGKTRAAASAKALSDEQLRAVFGAAVAEVEAAVKARNDQAERLDAHEVEARGFLNLLALVIHTAVRSHDARAARWEDIAEDRKVWTITQHKTSDHTGAPHVVPLSEGALAVLARIREANLAAGYGKSEWLFPADTAACEVCERDGHTDKDAKAAKRIKDAAGVEGRGLLHRMRDTFKTRASEHGIESRVSEAILAHVPPGIVGTYDHAELLPQRAEALDWWSAELGRILERNEERRGADVLPMRRA